MRYSDNAVETLVPGVFGLVNGIDSGGSAAGFGGPSLADAWGLHANYLEIIKPTLLFEAKVGKLYFNTESLPETYGQNMATSFGLQGINIDDRTSGLPNFDGGRLHDARRPALRADPAEEQHLAGPGVAHQHPRRPQPARRRRRSCAGRWRRSRATTAPASTPSPPRPPTTAPACGGDAAAAFLLGLAVHRWRAPTWWPTPRCETWEPSIFVQDDWRAREWLTLNLGLRYDVFTPFTEEDGEISNLDVNTLQFLIPGQNGAG